MAPSMGSASGGPQDLIGREIAGYRLEHVLGLGATGAVYLASRVSDIGDGPEQVAIKILLLPWQMGPEERDEFRARFLREAQTLQRLRHPHILAVLGVGEQDGLTYMVLPYVPGGTLATRLAAQRGPLPLDEVNRYLGQIADALDYAHSLGVVHRDIKPQNVLLDANGDLLLSDFGIARLMEETRTKLTSTGRIMGTPSYMAPEQMTSGRVGPAADIYSLGVVIFELVTGRVPFEADSLADLFRQHLQDPPPDPRLLRPDLPEPAAAILLKSLAKRPDGRFASAGDFARAFSQGLQGIWPAGMNPPPPPSQPADDSGLSQTNPPFAASTLPLGGGRRGSVGRTSALAAIGSLVLIVAVLAVLLFGSRGGNPTGPSGVVFAPTTTPYPPTSTTAPGQPTPTPYPATATPNLTPISISGTTPAGTTPTVTPTATDTPTPTGTPTETPLPSLPDSVFIGSNDHYIYALNAGNGALRWRYQTGGNAGGSRVAVANGVVYSGSADGYLYALDASSGNMLWRFYANGSVIDLPIVVNGVVYLGGSYTDVYALNAASGSVIWHFNAGGSSSQVSVDNGLVFFTYNYSVVALDASTGALRWQNTYQTDPISVPTAVNGVVYVSCVDSFSGQFRNVLYALNESDGSVIWGVQTDLNGLRYTQPAYANGVLYAEAINSNQYSLYALYASNGSVRWSEPLPTNIPPSPITNGVIYINVSNGVDAIDTNSGSVLWHYQDAEAGRPAVADGMVYFGDNNTYVTAITMSAGGFVWNYQTGGWAGNGNSPAIG